MLRLSTLLFFNGWLDKVDEISRARNFKIFRQLVLLVPF
jgi:hypothetical protein